MNNVARCTICFLVAVVLCCLAVSKPRAQTTTETQRCRQDNQRPDFGTALSFFTETNWACARQVLQQILETPQTDAELRSHSHCLLAAVYYFEMTMDGRDTLTVRDSVMNEAWRGFCASSQSDENCYYHDSPQYRRWVDEARLRPCDRREKKRRWWERPLAVVGGAVAFGLVMTLAVDHSQVGVDTALPGFPDPPEGN